MASPSIPQPSLEQLFAELQGNIPDNPQQMLPLDQRQQKQQRQPQQQSLLLTAGVDNTSAIKINTAQPRQLAPEHWKQHALQQQQLQQLQQQQQMIPSHHQQQQQQQQSLMAGGGNPKTHKEPQGGRCAVRMPPRQLFPSQQQAHQQVLQPHHQRPETEQQCPQQQQKRQSQLQQQQTNQQPKSQQQQQKQRPQPQQQQQQQKQQQPQPQQQQKQQPQPQQQQQLQPQENHSEQVQHILLILKDLEEAWEESPPEPEVEKIAHMTSEVIALVRGDITNGPHPLALKQQLAAVSGAAGCLRLHCKGSEYPIVT